MTEIFQQVPLKEKLTQTNILAVSEKGIKVESVWSSDRDNIYHFHFSTGYEDFCIVKWLFLHRITYQ